MDTWSPALAFERFELVRRVWTLTDAAGAVLAPQLRLRSDRRVACGPGGDVAGWDVRHAAMLVLLDGAGRAVACFDEIDTHPDGAVLRGTRVDDPDRTLTLRQTAPLEHWPDLAARHAPQPLEELQPRRDLLVTGAPLDAWEHDLAEEDRSWDLCLLGGAGLPDDELLPEYDADPPGAGRWDALHALLYPGSPLFRYDHVAFAHDAVVWSGAALNAAFAAAHAHDLMLAHPTAAPDCGLAARFHPVPGRVLGFGTPVGLLCPIFSAEALRVCAPTFALAPAGSPELAQLWTALLGAPATRIAVIDGTTPITLAASAAVPSTPALLERYGLVPVTRDAGGLHDASGLRDASGRAE